MILRRLMQDNQHASDTYRQGLDILVILFELLFGSFCRKKEKKKRIF